MITTHEVEAAMNLLATKVYKRCPMYANTITQLAYSLAVYADRGEYDGTLESAIACFELAGYEIANRGAL